MIKKIVSLLACVAILLAMLPAISTTVHAADPVCSVDIVEKYYYPESDSDPDTIPFSDFYEGFGGWSSGYGSPNTKDFTAMFVVFKVEVAIPAYTKIIVGCQPRAYASSPNFTFSGDFGLELFCFDEYAQWEELVFKTGTGDEQSSDASLAKTTANVFIDTNITLQPLREEKEFDNSNGAAKTYSFYYGILGYYRTTGLFEHQLSLGWDFESIIPYVDAKYIHYDANGGSGSADSVTAQQVSTVDLHSGDGFTKENSVFVGWAESPDGSSTTYAPGGEYSKKEGTKLYAQYLTYDLSNCTGTVTPGIRDANGIAIAGGENLHLTGHTFVKWEDEHDKTYSPGEVYSGNSGLTLSPIFDLNKYDLTLIADNCAVTVDQDPAFYNTNVEIQTNTPIGYQVARYDVYKTDDPVVKVPLTGANTFVQPEYPVTVKPVLSKIPYAIEKLPSENGSFTVSSETAGIDDVVTVTATPNEGFELDAITVTRANSGEPLTVTGNSFTMVPEPVKVAVAFKNSVYDITKAPATNGSFTLNPSSAIMYEPVVVNAVPDEGYRVKSITAYKTGDETVTVEVTAGSFIMPAFPVTVAVEFETAPLEIFKSTSIKNGDITISHPEAHPLDIVTLGAVGDEGYTLDAITVYKTQDPSVKVSVTDGSFVMPNYPVTVHATFKKIDYTVSVADDANVKGSFTVNKTTAQMGDTVTVDITCAEGWAVRGITLTNSNGESKLVDKVFTMPASNVTVSVSYMVIPTYVISIPASVELGGAPMNVAITNAVMEEGVSLKVHLETDFTARTAEGAVKSFTINGGAVQRGDVILTVEGGGTPEAPKSGSAQLALEWDEIYQYSGSYRASLAFTIKVEDAGYDQTE